ncbi:putative serine incorporator [Salvia divinorum]|uniref:Serine incorporator n=1 Tax=Salvia divinorum TaxID=28513 RepID=A0ABD1GWG8_SALDI
MDEHGRSVDPATIGTSTGGNEGAHGEELPGLEQKDFKCSAQKKMSLRARYAYAVVFLLTNIIAWLFRDYGERILPMLPYSRACGAEERKCYHTMGVLRVSLGCFIFFFIMFLTTCYTSKLYQVRAAWHSGWWGLKSVMLLISFMIPFFIPSDYIQLYGELARVGAGVFLILQLISVIEFITWWNNYWMPDDNNKSSNCSIGLFMSTVFYIASACGIAVMYVLYASKMSCTLNIFFITWTGVLLIVMMAISLHSRVNRGLLSSGIMASYIVFLCWSAIRSEPGTEKCSHEEESGHIGWSTIVGFVIALFAIVIATFSTGIDSQSFQFRKDEVEREEDDLPYGYGFFHLVFSLGAMYFAMLFISWNLGSLTRKWSIDVGWASTWVKIVNEWFAATIYMWKLIFPTLRETKVMNHEEETTEQV